MGRVAVSVRGLLPVVGCSSYGPGAYWWETEELVRKLLLTAVAVLLDAGSPLQARDFKLSFLYLCCDAAAP